MAEGLGGGYAAKGEPRKLNTGAKVAIGTVGALGAAAVIMGAVALSKLGPMNESIQKAQRTADSTAAVTDTLKADTKKGQESDSAKFVSLETGLGVLRVQFGDSAKSTNARLEHAENKLGQVGSDVAELSAKADAFQKYLDTLTIADSTLKADLQKLSNSTYSAEESIQRVMVFMALRERIDNWNSNRGGFIFGIGARKEIPQISVDTFNSGFKIGRIPSPAGVWSDVDYAFSVWLSTHGVKQK